MPEPTDTAPSTTARRRWLPRLRFSLRTLVIVVLLIGSAGGLWWHWEPWTIDNTYPSPKGKEVFQSRRCSETKRIEFQLDGSAEIKIEGIAQAVRIPDACDFGVFSPDEKIIAAPQKDLCGVGLWDVRTGSKLATLSGHQEQIGDMGFSPDGERIATTDNHEVRIWATASGKQLATLPHADSFYVCFFATGDRIRVCPFWAPGEIIWHRRRPEYWWGIAWLPEFWLTVLFTGVLVWSLWRDRKRIA